MTSTAQARSSEISRILGALGMLFGGVLILLAPAAAQAQGGRHLALFGSGCGFVLSMAGTWFAAPRASPLGQSLAVTGAALWVATGAAPFLMGWIYPLPLWGWAGLAASLFAASAVMFWLRPSLSGAIFGVLLSVCSAGSLLLVVDEPVFAPAGAHVPYALAVLFAALVSIVFMRRDERASSPQGPPAADTARMVQ